MLIKMSPLIKTKRSKIDQSNFVMKAFICICYGLRFNIIKKLITQWSYQLLWFSS